MAAPIFAIILQTHFLQMKYTTLAVKYLIFMYCCLSIHCLMAQDIAFDPANDSTQLKKKTKTPREKTVAINMTPLLSMVLPFNKTNLSLIGPYNITFKNYRNNHGWRLGLGASMANVDNPTNNDLRVVIGAGYGWRKPIYKRWHYTFGIDAMVFWGSLGVPNNTIDNSLFGVGIAPTWGIEYDIQDRVSLSTETALLVANTVADNSGFANEQLIVTFIPPIALFLNVKFGKKQR